MQCGKVQIGAYGLLCNCNALQLQCICLATIAGEEGAGGCWKLGKGADSHSVPMDTLLCTRVGCNRDAWAQVWCAWVGVPHSWAKVLFSEGLSERQSRLMSAVYTSSKGSCLFAFRKRLPARITNFIELYLSDSTPKDDQPHTSGLQPTSCQLPSITSLFSEKSLLNPAAMCASSDLVHASLYI